MFSAVFQCREAKWPFPLFIVGENGISSILNEKFDIFLRTFFYNEQVSKKYGGTAEMLADRARYPGI